MDIALEQFEARDFPRLISWSNSPELLFQFAGPIFTFPLDPIQLERYLRAAEGPSPSREIYKALLKDTEEIVGHIELDEIDRDRGCARLARVLVGSPVRRGKGIGSRMVERALERGFLDLDLHRIELLVFDFNAQAKACYEKAGFRTKTYLPNFRKFGGSFFNLYLMAVYRDDWQPKERR